jgi:hypothetical protein
MKQLNISESNISQTRLTLPPGQTGLTAVVVFIFCMLFLVSCAPQTRTESPHFGGMTLEDALKQYKKISSIQSVLGIEYEKDDSTMSGDGALSVSPDKLSLRIYYLGFLQGEIYQDKGTVKSNPPINRYKSAILVNGLKSSLFWWNINNYTTTETAFSYELKNSYRKVVIDKASLLPTEQILTLNNGEVLTITYSRPERRLTEDGKALDAGSPLGWYPSRLKIELGPYIVRINVKSYEITR